MINLNKAKWKTYNFSEISFNISERVEPKQTDLDIYVGLEHLDSDCLHIKRKGNPSDVKGIKLRVYPGDIIFGKRRAYQRKAAIVDFDGICSAHAMVVRANPKIISPALLPHFMHSDLFMHRAVDISEGSLSPTIKWKILAQQQFKLPPLDEQKRIADLLWSIDLSGECWKNLKRINEMVGKVLLRKALRFGLKDEGMVKKEIYSPFQTKIVKEDVPASWNVFQIRDIVESVQTGFAEGDRDDKGIQQLRMQNVDRDCSFVWEDIIRVPVRKGYEKYLLKNGDILFNNTNSDDLVGKSILFSSNGEPMVFSNHFTRIRVKSDMILSEYLYLWLRYHFEIGLFERRCTRWIGQAAVQTENLLSLYILLPPVTTQKDIVFPILAHDHLTDNIKDHIEKINKIKKTLLNQIFG